MANNLVQFFTCTQAQYDSKFSLNALSANALYFTSDTKRLYKGQSLYGGSLEVVSTLGASGAVGTLYYAQDTGIVSVWDGSAWVQKYLPVETSLSDSTSKVATSHAVKTYVDTAISGVNTTLTSVSTKVETLRGDDTTEGSVAYAVKAEATAREAADAVITGNILSGFTAENTVKAKITEIEGSIANIVEVGGTIDQKIAPLTAADAVITGNILSGFSADSTVSGEFAAVRSEFAAADSGLSDRIDALVNTDSVITGNILSGFSADSTVAGEFAAVRSEFAAEDSKLTGAIEELSGAIDQIVQDAISVSGAAGNAITVTPSGTDNIIGLTIKDGEKVLSQSANGLGSTITLAKLGTATEGFAASYQLQGIGGVALGDTINIPKDQFLEDATFIAAATSGDVEAGGVTLGEPCIKFTFAIKSKDSSGAETSTSKEVYIDVKDLVDTYTAASGVVLEGSVFKGVVDGTSEGFLTVGADGFKLSGVQSAIDAKATELSGLIGSGFTAESTVKGYVDGKVSDINTALSGKLGDVVSGKAGEIITATAEGKVQTSGKSVGGATLAASPDANTVATEAAVEAAISGAVDTINTALSGKLGDVTSGKAGELITATAEGKVQTSGKSVGGATLAASPDANTVATEAAVEAAISGAVAAQGLVNSGKMNVLGAEGQVSAGQILLSKADGHSEITGKTIGGSTLAGTPSDSVVATEAAVKTYVDSTVATALTWGTLE